MAYFIQDSLFISDERNIVNAGVVTSTDIDVSGNSAIGIATATDITIYNQLIDSNGNVGAGDSLLAISSDKLQWLPISALGIATAQPLGNTYFVSENGNNTNDGQTSATSWQTIGYALTQISGATNDVLVVAAGEYEETFPLEVPQGLTVRGAGQRATLIKPTSATETADGFLMNDATTVEDLSVGGFYKPAGISANNYAFSYAVGAAITTRSPYVSRVTVLNRGSNITANDPYGYSSADNYPTSAPGGSGVEVDGSILDPSSLEAGFLINEITIFSPNNVGVRMVNGARVEMMNSFTYFASEAIKIDTDTALGIAADGKTRLTVEGLSSTPNAADTIEYYDTDGITIIASGTIDNVSGNYITLDGAGTGTFSTAGTRTRVDVNFVGGAELSSTQAKFGPTSLDVTSSTTSVVTSGEHDCFGFGTGDFTIEGWYYVTSFAGNDHYLFDFRSTQATDQRLSLREEGTADLAVEIAGIAVTTTSTAALSENTWHHVAVSRSGTDLRVFIDGNSQLTYTDSTDLGPAAPLHLGADYLDSDGTSAFIDDFRIEKGVAKYTSNFTPPAAALKGDKDTSILLHFDGADGDTSSSDDVVIYQDIRITGGITGDRLTLADYSQFGGDLRSIGCALQYGGKGVVGDGAGAFAHLISINFSYIGAGGDIRNDPNKAIRENEVEATNDANLYYVSVDQGGDFRVGDSFYVNQETGAVSFSNTTNDLTSLSSLTITDGTNSTVLTPTSAKVGNIQVSGNTVESTTGDINLTTAGAGEIFIDSNTNITGILSASSITLSAVQNGDTSIALDDTGPTGQIRFITNGSEAGRFTNDNDLTVVGDVGSVNVSASSSVTAVTYYGDGSQLTGILTTGGGGGISGNLDVDSLEVNVGPSTFTGDVNLLDDLVGDGASDISGINSVTASNFYGDLEGGIVVEDGSTTATPQYVAFYNGPDVVAGVAATPRADDTLTWQPSTGTLESNNLELSGYISIATTATFDGHVQRKAGLTVTGICSATEFDTLSDIRLKENISPVDNALNKLVGITGVSYTWKDSGEATIGVIAQDVHSVFPELTQERDYMSVNYNGLIGVLIESVKELKDRVEELEAKLND